MQINLADIRITDRDINKHQTYVFRQLLERQRHHYEIIPQFAACHLYFDLEFSRETNPNRNGVTMTRHFIQYVCAMIARQWRVHCDVSDVLQLDARCGINRNVILLFDLHYAGYFSVFKVHVPYTPVCSQSAADKPPTRILTYTEWKPSKKCHFNNVCIR